ncbi:MAG: hypothetical protein FK732_08250 [Asgard group archaeon]|nr:hypothetical protein [Asgard group archaeon]
MRQRRIKIIVLCMLISFSLIASMEFKVGSATAPLDGVAGIILIAEDYDPGELDFVKNFMETYGCQIAIVGPTATVNGEYGSSIETDFLIGGFSGISSYDFLYVPGGGSPDNLIEISAALNLVKNAYTAGLVLAAICHGPLVFAEANIISGRNIAGNFDIKNDIENAGATYISEGISIDGPFVTADVGLMYVFAQQGIIKGLGLFEYDLPEIIDYTLDIESTEETCSISFIVEVFDEFDTASVIVKLYRFKTDTQEYVLSRQIQLSRNEDNTIYSNTLGAVLPGNYSLYLTVEDVLGNIGTYEDVYKFIVDPNTAGLGFTLINFLPLFGISLVTLVYVRKKAK